MKSYVKSSQEKSSTRIYYLSSDLLTHRILQSITTKEGEVEQQLHFLSSFNTPRLQHRHVGRYGIKPIDSGKTRRYSSKVISS